MKPNIFLVIIDSLRSDKITNNQKTDLFFNFNQFIHESSFFSQAISASDGTNVSLGSIFTGEHPFNHKITWYQNYSNAKKSLNILKNNGYKMFATLPDMPFFETLTSDFDDKELVSDSPYMRIFEGFGEKIISKLNSIKNTTPWFYYTHIMDLHTTKKLPDEFLENNNGEDSWNQRLSIIDTWFGKILEKIDLKNTIVVLTADHGEFDHDLDVDFGEMPKLQNFLKHFKSKLPQSIESAGVKSFEYIRENKRKRSLEKHKKSLNRQEIRNISSRGSDQLFDDVLRIPLGFSGFGIKKNIITQQVRHVDILPTILDITGIKHNQKFDGTSLLPLFNNEKIDELPAYLESIPNMNHELGNSVGLRTTQYKYFRSRKNSNENLHLYNLILDPKETNNIANENPKLVSELEEKLVNIQNNSISSNNTEKMSEEKIAKAKQILKELGYDK